jgi:hypothetical protein
MFVPGGKITVRGAMETPGFAHCTTSHPLSFPSISTSLNNPNSLPMGKEPRSLIPCKQNNILRLINVLCCYGNGLNMLPWTDTKVSYKNILKSVSNVGVFLFVHKRNVLKRWIAGKRNEYFKTQKICFWCQNNTKWTGIIDQKEIDV